MKKIIVLSSLILYSLIAYCQKDIKIPLEPNNRTLSEVKKTLDQNDNLHSGIVYKLYLTRYEKFNERKRSYTPKQYGEWHESQYFLIIDTTGFTASITFFYNDGTDKLHKFWINEISEDGPKSTTYSCEDALANNNPSFEKGPFCLKL